MDYMAGPTRERRWGLRIVGFTGRSCRYVIGWHTGMGWASAGREPLRLASQLRPCLSNNVVGSERIMVNRNE